MQRARSAHEIIGLESLGGLPPLSGEEALPVAYPELREELAEILRQAKEKSEFITSLGLGKRVAVIEEKQFGEFIGRLEEQVPQGRKEDFQNERVIAQNALTTGTIEASPNLNVPEHQLLWAAVLAHLSLNGKIEGAFNDHAVVRAIIDSEYVDTMLMDFAMNVGLDARVVLGPPGSWFYFDPSHQIINLDLFYSLIAGGHFDPKTHRIGAHFESLFHHEHGHARFSHDYPVSMQKLWAELRRLSEKGGMEIPSVGTGEYSAPKDYKYGEGVSVDELKQLEALHEEWSLRQHFWNAAEDNCVNRYNCNLADPKVVEKDDFRHPVHLADALNVAITIVNSAGKRVREYKDGTMPERKDSAASRLANLSNAVNMCFFVGNHLVPDTKEGWQALGVNLDWLSDKDIKRIQLLTKRIELCQPKPLEEALGPRRLREAKEAFEGSHDWLPAIAGEPASVATYDEWVLYHNRKRNIQIETLFEEFANPLIEQIMRERKPQIDKEVDKMLSQLKQKGQGQGQDGEPGQGTGKGRSGGKASIRVKGVGDATTSKTPSPSPQEEQKEEREKKRQGKGETEINKEKEGAESTQGLKKRRMDGVGKRGQKRPTQRDTGRKQKPLENPLSAGQGHMSQSASNAQSPLDSLELGDGRSYKELLLDPIFHNAVSQISRDLKRISDRAKQFVSHKHPREHDLAPEGEDFLDRLDTEKVIAYDRKRSTGEPLQRDDFAFFHSDFSRTQATEGDIVILLDGSGSMGSGMGSYMEYAMKTAALLQCAAQKSGYRVFITLWGDNNPFLVVEPGMDIDTIAQNIDGVINGKQSGTLLAPSVTDALDRMLDQRRSPGTKRGFTHLLVVSDGHTYDDDMSKKRLQAMLNHVRGSTVDALLVQSREGSLAHTIESLKALRAHQKPCVTVLSSIQKLPHEVVSMTKNRVRSCSRNMMSEDEEQYRHRLRQARNKGVNDTSKGRM